jgi:hypothetical protein
MMTIKHNYLSPRIRGIELRKEVRHGFEQIERGEYTTYSSANELSDEIKAEGRKKAAQRKVDAKSICSFFKGASFVKIDIM